MTHATRTLLLVILTCFVSLSSFMGSAHGQGENQTGTTTYRGIVLPPAPTVRGATAQPPPAWLVVDKKASAASYGSFCYATACVDMVPPSMRPDLATVTATRAQRVYALIQSRTIGKVAVTLRPWTSPASTTVSARSVRAHRRQDGTWTVLTLTLSGPLKNQLLSAQVTFKAGGDASYLWRLNPSSRTVKSAR